MRYERKVYLSSLLLVLAFVPIIGAAFFSLREIVRTQNELVSTNAREQVLAERLAANESIQASHILIFVMSGDEKIAANLLSIRAEFTKTLAAFKAIEKDPEALSDLSKLQVFATKLEALANDGLRLRRIGSPIKTVHAFFQKHAAPIADEQRLVISRLVERESDELKVAKAEAARISNFILNGMIALTVVTLGFVILIGILISRNIRQKRKYDDGQRALFLQEKKVSLARKETVEVVAHDLKSPLSSIMMSVDLILEDLAPASNSLSSSLSSSLRDDLGIVQRSAQSMHRLITDLLDHAKIEAGSLQLEPKDCDISHLLGDLQKRFEGLARARGINFSTVLDEPLPAMSCDVGRIEQVVSNFLSNALKFTPPDGSVELSAKRMGEKVIVAVRDDGPGIPQSQVGCVFERFWQQRETSKQGTGLGLAIAKAIIDSHHGEIWVESQVGRGSTFSFSLPVLPSGSFERPQRGHERSFEISPLPQ